MRLFQQHQLNEALIPLQQEAKSLAAILQQSARSIDPNKLENSDQQATISILRACLQNLSDSMQKIQTPQTAESLHQNLLLLLDDMQNFQQQNSIPGILTQPIQDFLQTAKQSAQPLDRVIKQPEINAEIKAFVKIINKVYEKVQQLVELRQESQQGPKSPKSK